LSNLGNAVEETDSVPLGSLIDVKVLDLETQDDKPGASATCTGERWSPSTPLVDNQAMVGGYDFKESQFNRAIQSNARLCKTADLRRCS